MYLRSFILCRHCSNSLTFSNASDLLYSLFSIVILTVSYFSLNYRNRVSVKENTPAGTVVFQVRATDADYGNNSIITYSLLPSEHAAKFSIGASSGNITLIGKLDRENTSEIILRINATDGTFTVTSELFVVITDVNDNKPIFTSRCSLLMFIWLLIFKLKELGV